LKFWKLDGLALERILQSTLLRRIIYKALNYRGAPPISAKVKVWPPLPSFSEPRRPYPPFNNPQGRSH